MNELQLSNDLTTIETEIKSYQNIAGQSIFEIGRRLKHVKENDLAHGEFGKWLEKIGMHRQQAHQFIKISKEFENTNVTARLHLGVRALYQLATMPKEQREDVIRNGIETKDGKKSIEEVTTRELEDYKKRTKTLEQQNAHLQSQVEQAQRSEEIAKKQLEDAESREPEVIEKYMEPEDYQETKNALAQSRHHQKLIEERNAKLEKEIEDMKHRRDEVSEKSQKYDELNKAINNMNSRLNEGQQKLKAQKEIYELVKGSEQVIREVAPLCYLAFSKDIIDNDYARKPIEKIIEDLTDMANRLRKQIKQGDVIDV